MIRLEGKVSSFSFNGQPISLKTVSWQDFDINRCPSSCKLEMPDGSVMALSRWVSPKRTRSYPFARIYDTYSHNGKIVTVIPVIKDEGADGDNDRVNYISLSWMNFTNVYILLSWYDEAQPKQSALGKQLITCQHFSNEYVKEMLQKIGAFKQDAHHWNNLHFREDFVPIYDRAVQAYHRIQEVKTVQLHSQTEQYSFLDRVRDPKHSHLLDLTKFREVTLAKSLSAAYRETGVDHEKEQLQPGTQKALIEVTNDLGGKYALTADEVLFQENERIIIQESKNTIREWLPSCNDIKDGLFKLLLYSQFKSVVFGDREWKCSVRLRATSRKFMGSLILPGDERSLSSFADSINLPAKKQSILKWLNEEAKRLGIPVILEGM